MSARDVFYTLSIVGVLLVIPLGLNWPLLWWLLLPLAAYVLLGLWDIFVSKSNVLTNYPVIGHARYALEFISPEIRQYFIETNENGRPYNRLQRQQVYARAEGRSTTLPFGTQYDLEQVGYHRADHSLAPREVPASAGRVLFGGRHVRGDRPQRDRGVEPVL